MAKQVLLVRTDWRAIAVFACAKAVFDCRKIFFAIPIFFKTRAPTRARGIARKKSSRVSSCHLVSCRVSRSDVLITKLPNRHFAKSPNRQMLSPLPCPRGHIRAHDLARGKPKTSFAAAPMPKKILESRDDFWFLTQKRHQPRGGSLRLACDIRRRNSVSIERDKIMP
jgi:hypothetical protein